MTSDDLFLQDCIAYVRSRQPSPDTELFIRRTSDGWRMAICQNSTGIHSVDVRSSPSTLAAINRLLAYCIQQVGDQLPEPKHTLRPSANDRLSQAGLRRYPRPGGRSTKKT